MKEAGKHDFDGACSPDKYLTFSSLFESFSVGIFEWIPKQNGRGTKKGKVKVRVKGLTSEHEKVEGKAREIVAALDAGVYVGPRNVKV